MGLVVVRLAAPVPVVSLPPAAPLVMTMPAAAPGLLATALPLAAPAPAVQAAMPALQLTAARLAAPAADPEAGNDYLNRLFGEKAMGGGDKPEPIAELPALKADVERFLSHVAAEKPGWRGLRAYSDAVAARVERVSALGGIPRREPDGWLKTKTVVEPLRPELLGVLPEFAGTVRILAERARSEDQFIRDVSDFLYSFNTLAQRQPSVELVLREIRWLYGTYRLGRP